MRLAATCLFMAATRLAAADVTIDIDASRPGPRINPRLYGIFLEEINHGVDGGLYAELVRNRGFEDARSPEGYTLRDGRWVDPHGFDSGFAEFGYAASDLPFWSLVRDGDAQGSIQLDRTGGITDASSYCLRLTVDRLADGRLGVANEGFFGIGLKRGARYALSLFARGGDGFRGPLTVRLEDGSGAPCSDTVTLDNIGAGWAPLPGSLTATRDESKARLVVTAAATGRVWLDLVSLFPSETWKGRPNGLRTDIAQMIADLKPGFVRFPGGCVVEGGTVETAYDWKLTVGPIEKRAERWGPWHYRRTHGMGLAEYLQFCEDLGAEPLWVGFAGQTCIFRERENVPMERMEPVRQSFLDLVEFANGSPASEWGALRAQAGHPAPFGLKYVEIGNENAGPEYEERYRFIHDALKARHPGLTYLADLSFHRMPAGLYDIADMHYYSSPFWFLTHFGQFDARDRSLAPLYLGEVAVTSKEGGPLRGNLTAALAEGVYLMGCERNADAVRMVSYAPLLAHVNGRTWDWHGMIYHDGTRVFGTVSYYLWKLFGTNLPSYSVATEVNAPESKPLPITGAVGVGTWNTAAEFRDVRLTRGDQTLAVPDFGASDGGWKQEGGEWSVVDGAYRQGAPAIGLSTFGDESWSDYTLSLKARKLSGAEGFLVVFGRRGEDKYWWNVGGWGNREHALQFNQNVMGERKAGSVETGRWYDLRVEVAGRRVRCSLDGVLIHDETVPAPQSLYALAGRDEATGDLIVKAINVAAQAVPATLRLNGLDRLAAEAEVTTLTANAPDANNSLDAPAAVMPTASRLSTPGPTLLYEFPPRSLTLIRFKTR